MGYYSNFDIVARPKDNKTFTEEQRKKFLSAFKKIIEPDNCYEDDKCIEISIVAKWYNCINDLVKLMNNFPDIELSLQRAGEDSGDYERHIWKSSVKYDQSPLNVQRPITDGSTATIAVISTREHDTKVSLISVPTDKVEEYAEEHFSSNDTWNVVNVCNIFGETFRV